MAWPPAATHELIRFPTVRIVYIATAGSNHGLRYPPITLKCVVDLLDENFVYGPAGALGSVSLRRRPVEQLGTPIRG